MGQALRDILYPPPPPAYLTSPIAFGEHVNQRGSGPPSWQSYKHIEVMEKAFLDAINPELNPDGGRLIVTVSVRMGKSMYGSRIFPAWFLGKNPDKRVMLIGHEADFASRHGRAARDMLTAHGHLFGVQVSAQSQAANRWDLDGREGGMLTLGIGGSPIGRGGDLAIVDDPYRNFADAMSPRVRKEVIEFVAGTMFSRVQAGGTIIIIMARWHPEDLVGHLLATQPGVWTELRMPALCTDPENDPTGRALGEPLWPEVWPKKALEQRRKEVSIEDGEVVWDAQYQQDPQASEGDMFDAESWKKYSGDPMQIVGIKRWVRAWDLAATKGDGDWTVGLLMGEMPDDAGWVVADIVRGRWASSEVRGKMRECAAKDPRGTIIRFPQDPGQAGKEQKEQISKMLRGHILRAKPVTGAKEIRAGGVSSQQLVGNLWYPGDAKYATWRGALIAETNAFPYGTHDDIVDALADAFNTLAGNRARLLA